MKIKLLSTVLVLFSLNMQKLDAQTDIDGLMMSKNILCSGLIFGNSNWKNYWEGDFKRTNGNIGNIITNQVTFMANYGLGKNTNIIAMFPYFSTKATQGTLIGMSGFQDINLLVKQKIKDKTIKRIDWSLLTTAGISSPSHRYIADYLPLSIGMGAKTAHGRIIIDGQKNNFYVTAASAFILRSNVTIDRDAYYTTHLIYGTKVAMPNVWANNFKIGYRKNADRFIEIIIDQQKTLGGFDIRKNDMPFLSNTMNFWRMGINFKYQLPRSNSFSLVGNIATTLHGRNVGQATLINLGVFFQTSLKK